MLLKNLKYKINSGRTGLFLMHNLFALYYKVHVLLSGTFCDKGRKCENGPNLPLGSLEVLFMENQAQNSKCIINKRLMVLWQERIKMLTTKVQKKHKNITSLKLRPIVTRRRKLREVVRKRIKIPLYPYFHP